MSRLEKMKSRLLSEPKDYTIKELETLLKNMGFILSNAGKTSGSAIKFIHAKTNYIINLHKPHPSPIIKSYLMKDIISTLKQGGYLNDK